MHGEVLDDGRRLDDRGLAVDENGKLACRVLCGDERPEVWIAATEIAKFERGFVRI